MADRAPEKRRRRFIKLTAVGLAVAPLVNMLLIETARADELLSEADPAAKALKYRADATLSPDRKDPTAVCDNCALFTPKDGPASGTCELFKGKRVAAKGWCTSWEGF